jgi:hypothetical protein
MASRRMLWSWAACALLAGQRVGAQGGTQGQGGIQEERFGPLAVFYSHTNSDNVERIVGGHRGSFDSLGITVNHEAMSERVEAAVNGHVQYRTYSLDELENETLGELRATGDFAIVPERFSWLIEDSYAQGATDPFAFEGPGNRESINVLQTGPELTLPFARRMGVILGSLYSDRRYGESRGFDNQSLRSEATLYRQSSPTARFSLSLIDSDIEYDSGLPGYEIETVQLGYSKELASGDVLAELGENRVVFDASETTGPLYRLEWRRDVTARSQVGFIAGRQLTDAGELFGLVTGQVAADQPLGILLTSNPLQLSQAGFEYGYTGDRTTVRVRVTDGQEEYELDSSLDNDSVNTSVEFLRLLNPRWNLGLSLASLKRDFEDGSQETRDGFWNVWIDRSLGSRFLVEFAMGQNERSGTATAPKERLYSFHFFYTPRRT